MPTQHPIIEDITKNTYGIILYQEQMMRLVHELAGFDWKVAEKIRKVVAKSKGSAAIMEFQDKFVRGCLKKETIGENEAVQLWNTLASFGEYSFNKSHAVAYSTISYWCMWLKINYPVEYICALLTYGSNDKDRKNEYIDEAFRLGLDLRPPKIGISLSKEWRVYNEKLYAPFIEIKGVGDKTADAFSRINKEGFFQKKDKERAVSSKFMKILDELNAYEDCRCPDDRVDIISNLLGINLRNTYKNVRKRRRNWD